MNKELNDKYLSQLNDLITENDVEKKHIDADNILCELLKELGFNEIVESFNKLKKWYGWVT